MTRIHRKMGFHDAAYAAVGLGIFEIDEEGCIWRLKENRGKRHGHPSELVSCIPRRAEHQNSYGYLVVAVTLEGVSYSAYAHRLVWIHENRREIPHGLTINHKDGNKMRNHPSNLELATNSEQTIHAIKALGWKSYKNMSGKNSQPGERNAMAKLTEEKVKAIRAECTKRGDGRRLAQKYGVAPSVISRIKNKQMWTSA